MKIHLKVLLCFLFFGCAKDEKIVENFELNTDYKGIIHYENNECEFNNRDNQTQHGTTFGISEMYPTEYLLTSFYTNKIDNNSINNIFSIDLVVNHEGGSNKKIKPEYLENILKFEDSSEYSNQLYPRVVLQICEKSYSNAFIGSLGINPKFHENFKYKINDFEVLYNSECVEKELLYIDITIEGMLYESWLGEIRDSLFLNESKMKLLFDMNTE